MKLKKFLHLFIILTMMSFFMFGCRNAEADTDSSTETETISAEAPETATEVYVEEETTEVEESEVVPEEEVAEDPEEVVTEEPTQPEEVEEPVATDEPVEVISIKEHADLTNYIATLDPDQPEIIIYNKFEMYMIHMKEGQHYQLKSNDEIIFNISDPIGCGWNFDLGADLLVIENYLILQTNFSNWEQNQEFFFSKRNENDEKVTRTCYFDPPTE